MKQAGYPKRHQSRSSERHRLPQKHINGDSGEGKMRGNPQQFVDKYLSLARDAASAGDPVSAENYYQYADHYYRLTLANRAARSEKNNTFRKHQSDLSEIPSLPSSSPSC